MNALSSYLDDGGAEQEAEYCPVFDNLQQYSESLYEATTPIDQLYHVQGSYAFPMVAPAASPSLDYNHNPPQPLPPAHSNLVGSTTLQHHRANGAPRKKILHACQHCRR